VADIKAAEIPKAMGALAEVTLAMVTPPVMIPEMVISQKLMMLVVMVESGVIDALTAGCTPTRSNVTVTLPSSGRRQWARAVGQSSRTEFPAKGPSEVKLLAIPSATPRS
jgi:hypothetical protein